MFGLFVVGVLQLQVESHPAALASIPYSVSVVPSPLASTLAYNHCPTPVKCRATTPYDAIDHLISLPPAGYGDDRR